MLLHVHQLVYLPCGAGQVEYIGLFRDFFFPENNCLLWLETMLMRAVRLKQNSEVAGFETNSDLKHTEGKRTVR